MKRWVVLVLLMVLVVGCGKKDTEKKYEGVAEKTDYITVGMKYLNKGDVARAIRSFDLAIKQNPRNAKSYITLGEVYLKLKNYTKAIDTFRAAARVDPSDGQIYYLLSTSEGLDGRIDKAIISAQRSADLFMQSKDQERLKKAILLYQGLVARKKSLEISENMPVEQPELKEDTFKGSFSQ